jgi:hypothetical protein
MLSRQLEHVGMLLIQGDQDRVGKLLVSSDAGAHEKIVKLGSYLARVLQSPLINPQLYKSFATILENAESFGTKIPILAIEEGSDDWRIFFRPGQRLAPVEFARLIFKPNSIGAQSVNDSQTRAYDKREASRIVINDSQKSQIPKIINNDEKGIRESLSVEDPEIEAVMIGEIESLIDSLDSGERVILGRGLPIRGLQEQKSISREHLELRRVSLVNYVIRDLSSTNGSFYRTSQSQSSGSYSEWSRIQDAISVKPGTQVRMGQELGGVVFEIPHPLSPLAFIRSTLLKELIELRNNEEIHLSQLADVYPSSYASPFVANKTSFSKQNRWTFFIAPDLSGAPCYFLNKEGAWVRFTNKQIVAGGTTIRIGKQESGIEVTLPIEVSEKISLLKPKQKLSLGRTLSLESYNSLSRDHAVIYSLSDSSYVVRDLASSNGTFCRSPFRDWVRIRSSIRVRAGDDVCLGSGAHALCLVMP